MRGGVGEDGLEVVDDHVADALAVALDGGGAVR